MEPLGWKDVAIFSSLSKLDAIIEGYEYFRPFHANKANSHFLRQLLSANESRFSFARMHQGIDKNGNDEETSEDQEDVFDGDDMKRASNANPNAFYYRNPPGAESSSRADCSANKFFNLFIQRAFDRGVNDKWGIFSKPIPERVGYQCERYWKRLIEKRTVKDLNCFKRGTGIIPHKVRKYSFIVFNEDAPYYHPKFPSDDELLCHLQYIGVYLYDIDSFPSPDAFCEYMCQCNGMILPEIAAEVYGYLAKQKQIGWISKWAADILAPLLYEKKIKICTDANSVKWNQLRIKKIAKEWPQELDKYISWQQ